MNIDDDWSPWKTHHFGEDICIFSNHQTSKSKPTVFGWIESTYASLLLFRRLPVNTWRNTCFFACRRFPACRTPNKKEGPKNFPNKLSGIHIFPILSQAYGCFVGISPPVTPPGTIIQPRELKQVEEAELVGVAQRRPLNTCKTAHSLGVSHLVCWKFCKWLFW